jgi:hypothetical protein
VNSGAAGYLAYYPSTGTTVDDQTTLYLNTTNNTFGIGSTSPHARLSVDTTSLGTTSAFLIGSSTRTLFKIDNSGNILVGTTSITGSAQATSTRFLMAGGTFMQQHVASGTIGSIGIVGGVKDATNLNGIVGVAVQGRYAYVVNNSDDSLRIIDVSTPTNPVIVGGVKDATNLNGAYSVAVSGRYAYVSSNLDESVRIIDISNPAAPFIVSGIKDTSLLNGVRGVAVAGRYLYIANGSDDSLRIMDVSNPLAPVFVGGIKNSSTLNGARTVAVSGNYAYVANELDDSLRIIDVSNPANPVIVGGVQDTTDLNSAYFVAVAGRYAYVVNELDNSLRIIDVSNPASPSIVGGIKDNTNLNSPRSVVVAGRYAYVNAYSDDAFRIIDISDPTNPYIVGGMEDGANLSAISSIAVSGRYAYVASNGDSSLRIIDLGGIDSPAANIGAIVTNTLDTDTLRGGNAYLTSLGIGQGGLYSQGPGAFTLSATTSLTGTPALTATVNDTNVSSIVDALALTHTATGTIANGIGTGLLFNTEYAGTAAASTTATSTHALYIGFSNSSRTSPSL